MTRFIPFFSLTFAIACSTEQTPEPPVDDSTGLAAWTDSFTDQEQEEALAIATALQDVVDSEPDPDELRAAVRDALEGWNSLGDAAMYDDALFRMDQPASMLRSASCHVAEDLLDDAIPHATASRDEAFMAYGWHSGNAQDDAKFFAIINANNALFAWRDARDNAQDPNPYTPDKYQQIIDMDYAVLPTAADTMSRHMIAGITTYSNNSRTHSFRGHAEALEALLLFDRARDEVVECWLGL